MNDELPSLPKELLVIARQAARICREMANVPNLLGQTDLEISGVTKCSDMAVTTTLTALKDFGWVIDEGGPRRQLVASKALLRRLGDRLEGAADSQEKFEPPLVPEVILTRPSEPSRLLDALAELRAPSTYWTRDGFVHLAAQASDSLRIMTPFIDEEGARLVANMFSRTKARRRVLILRPDSRRARPWMKYISNIASADVTIGEYWVESTDSRGDVRIETFHAKVIVADDQLAYVGSSNFVSASLDRSLECGVLLRGREVRVVSVLMDAVERISSSIFPIREV